MRNIIGFEKGKETEKAIKQALGLPIQVSKTGKIDAVYNGVTIEIKRGACRLYAGKRFTPTWTAQTATEALYVEAYQKTGKNPLTQSDVIAYSIDGTAEQTYIIDTALFLYNALQDKAVKLSARKDGRTELRIKPTTAFLLGLTTWAGTQLNDWKAKQDRQAQRA